MANDVADRSRRGLVGATNHTEHTLRETPMTLKLAIFVDATHQDRDRDALHADVAQLLPEGRFLEDLDHAKVQRVLTYEFDQRPELERLERLDHLDWVTTSEGTAWTGPLPEPPPRVGTGQCPFAAMAESMSEEEMKAFLDEHRERQATS